MAWPGPLLLKDRKGRAYLVFPKEGGVFHHHKGSVPHEALLEAGPGGVVRTHLGEELSVHRPTLEEYLLHMKRSATPTYPKDASAMVTLLDLAPGMRVLEAGTGSGGLTLFLARAVGEKGLVESYEARPHHLAQAERNVRAFWQVENVRFHLGKLEEAELEEAAYVDGATPLQTLLKVMLPLTGPGLVTTGLLAFIAAWNEYLFALTFTVGDSVKTVPPAIASFGGATPFEIPWGSIMAASVVVTVPLVVLVLVFQQRIVAGLTAGAVKG